MSNQVTQVADEIYRELGEPEDVSIPTIDFWLRTNLGLLNSRLDIYVEIADNDFSPRLNSEEKEILKSIYKIEWYARQIRRFSGAGGIALDQVVSLKENGRTTTLAKRTDTMKILAEFRNDLVKELQGLVSSYRFNRADSRESKIIEDDCYGLPLPPYPWRSREF